MEQRADEIRQRGAVSDVDPATLARLLRLEADRLERIRDEMRSEREKLELVIQAAKSLAA
jgi:hypothetical protein